MLPWFLASYSCTSAFNVQRLKILSKLEVPQELKNYKIMNACEIKLMYDIHFIPRAGSNYHSLEDVQIDRTPNVACIRSDHFGYSGCKFQFQVTLLACFSWADSLSELKIEHHI